MSDYLSRLLTRSLRPAQTIQPRLAGRYESPSYQDNVVTTPPVDVAGAENPGPGIEDAWHSLPSSAGQPSPALYSQVEPYAFSAETVPDAPAGRMENLQPPAERSLPLQTPSMSKAARSPAGAESVPALGSTCQAPDALTPNSMKDESEVAKDYRVPVETPIQPTSESAAQSAAPTAGDFVHEPLSQAGTQARNSVAQPMTVPQHPENREREHTRALSKNAEPLENAKHKEVAAPAEGEPVTPAAISERILSPSGHTVSVQPHVTGDFRSATSAPSHAAAGSESSEPRTVQVTIGRIEVRAIPPARTPPKRRAASSAMSLDDYLRQRNGEKR